MQLATNMEPDHKAGRELANSRPIGAIERLHNAYA